MYIRHGNCAVETDPFHLIKLFALWQHQMHFSIALMTSSYSTVFWLSLYTWLKHEYLWQERPREQCHLLQISKVHYFVRKMELTEEIWKSGKSNIMVENMKYNRYM